jgi:hypothetical protein
MLHHNQIALLKLAAHISKLMSTQLADVLRKLSRAQRMLCKECLVYTGENSPLTSHGSEQPRALTPCLDVTPCLDAKRESVRGSEDDRRTSTPQT